MPAAARCAGFCPGCRFASALVGCGCAAAVSRSPVPPAKGVCVLVAARCAGFCPGCCSASALGGLRLRGLGLWAWGVVALLPARGPEAPGARQHAAQGTGRLGAGAGSAKAARSLHRAGIDSQYPCRSSPQGADGSSSSHRPPAGDSCWHPPADPLQPAWPACLPVYKPGWDPLGLAKQSEAGKAYMGNFCASPRSSCMLARAPCAVAWHARKVHLQPLLSR